MLNCISMIATQVISEDPQPEISYKVQEAVLRVKDQTYPIYRGDNLVGRLPSCPVFLQFPTVSGKHACIEVEGPDSHVIYDVGSTNKTRLGKTCLKPNVRYHINDGDSITFGNLVTTYTYVVGATENEHDPLFTLGGTQLLIPESPEPEPSPADSGCEEPNPQELQVVNLSKSPATKSPVLGISESSSDLFLEPASPGVVRDLLPAHEEEEEDGCLIPTSQQQGQQGLLITSLSGLVSSSQHEEEGKENKEDKEDKENNEDNEEIPDQDIEVMAPSKEPSVQITKSAENSCPGSPSLWDTQAQNDSASKSKSPGMNFSLSDLPTQPNVSAGASAKSPSSFMELSMSDLPTQPNHCPQSPFPGLGAPSPGAPSPGSIMEQSISDQPTQPSYFRQILSSPQAPEPQEQEKDEEQASQDESDESTQPWLGEDEPKDKDKEEEEEGENSMALVVEISESRLSVQDKSETTDPFLVDTQPEEGLASKPIIHSNNGSPNPYLDNTQEDEDQDKSKESKEQTPAKKAPHELGTQVPEGWIFDNKSM